MRSELLDIFRRRHACHLFQSGHPIPKKDLEYILEAGRLSPSSFGLEPWKFVVLSSPRHKLTLQAACFQQPQVGTASCNIVILGRVADMHPESDYVRRLLAREYPGEQLEMALKNYRGFHANTDMAAWSITQCHIAAANMMTAATAIGIDSCAIGGFLPDEVKRMLDIPPASDEVALILAMGYCAEAAGEKQRLSLDELVEFR